MEPEDGAAWPLFSDSDEEELFGRPEDDHEAPGEPDSENEEDDPLDY